MKYFFNEIKKCRAFSVFLLVLIAMVFFSITSDYGGKEVKYTKFMELAEGNEIETAVINNSYNNIYFEDKKGQKYVTTNPKSEELLERVLLMDIKVKTVLPKQGYAEISSTLSFILVALLGYLVYKSVIILQGMPRKRMPQRKINGIEDKENKNVQKRKKKNSNSFFKINTTLELTVIEPGEVLNLPKFDDIAGNNEVKQELKYVVEFLKNPTLYNLLGASLPKGILLSGPPGTGKTMIAKAVASEANVAFIPVSGSDFIQEYVGVGAKRIRQVFDEARKYEKTIIFIDEFDAIAGDRSKSTSSENRQAINALLDEIDGFVKTEGIIVLAATNFVETLDNALIRPGRFDKKITFSMPSFKDRFEILKIHAKNKPLANDVDLEHYAKMTISMSGAYLATLLNEAAINAANNKRTVIENVDLDTAYNNIMMNGLQQHDKKHNEEEIRMVAMHEAGHVVAAKRLTNKDVAKATIVSNTSGAGGYALMIPKEGGFKTIKDFENDIRISYAGRAAEQIHFGNIADVKDTLTKLKHSTSLDPLSGYNYSIGASSDIQHATKNIQYMMMVGGMGKTLGMLNGESLGIDFKDPTMLEEARVIARTLYIDALELIVNEHELVTKIAESLLEKETLVEQEILDIIQIHDEQKIA